MLRKEILDRELIKLWVGRHLALTMIESFGFESEDDVRLPDEFSSRSSSPILPDLIPDDALPQDLVSDSDAEVVLLPNQLLKNSCCNSKCLESEAVRTRSEKWDRM